MNYFFLIALKFLVLNRLKSFKEIQCLLNTNINKIKNIFINTNNYFNKKTFIDKRKLRKFK